MERTTLKYRDRKWYIVAEYSLQNEPMIRQLWWNTTRGERIGALNPVEHDHRELYRIDPGNYRVMPKSDSTETIYGRITVMIDPKAQADIVEEIPFECPKTRKGIETRYHYGRWEKYSKREGWIAA